MSHQKDIKNEEPKCPFCGSNDHCKHLLLCLDETFRTAEGGLLMDAFNERWSRILDEHQDEPDFDEHDAFCELQLEVDGFAGATAEYEFEGGPGMSSKNALYYVKTARGAVVALKEFRKK